MGESMKHWLAVIGLISILSACASGGPVPMGGGTYYLDKISPACGFSNGDGAKKDLLREASDFCVKQGKEVAIDSAINKNGVVGHQCASAEVTFKCVQPGSTTGGHYEEHSIQ